MVLTLAATLMTLSGHAKVLEYSLTRPKMREPVGTILKWKPEFEQFTNTPRQCRPETVAAHLDRFGPTYLARLLDTCRDTWQSGISIPKLNQILNMFVRYPYEQNKNIHQLRLGLSNGHEVIGHLALQPGLPRRPLVVFQCGLRCSLSNPSLKTVLIHLYDEGPFHVLLLPSVTSTEYVTKNKTIIMGGLYEGSLLIDIIQFIRGSNFKYSDRFSSIHAAGISLGGHSALYSSLYHDTWVRQGGEPFINSFFAGCPVVDLKRSMKELFTDWFYGRLIVSDFWSLALKLVDQLPILSDVLKNLPFDDDRMNTLELVQRLNLTYHKSMSAIPGTFLPPFDYLRLRSDEEVWHHNDFINFLDFVESPLMIWAPMDDQVVHYKQNSEYLERHFDSKPTHHSFLLRTQYGGHCGFASSYNWESAGQVLRYQALRHSPELKVTKLTKKLPPKVLKHLGLGRSGHWSRQSIRFTIEPGDTEVRITSRLVKRHCHKRRRRPTQCSRTRVAHLPLSFFGVENRAPANEAEADSLSRWFNAQVRFQDHQGLPPLPKSHLRSVAWKNYWVDQYELEPHQ